MSHVPRHVSSFPLHGLLDVDAGQAEGQVSRDVRQLVETWNASCCPPMKRCVWPLREPRRALLEDVVLAYAPADWMALCHSLRGFRARGRRLGMADVLRQSALPGFILTARRYARACSLADRAP